MTSRPLSARVIDIQSTPNPNAMKFVLDRSISDAPTSFFNPAAAANHPLAKELFAIEGVTSVLLLGDFVTVNKSSATPWKDLSPKVKKILETA